MQEAIPAALRIHLPEAVSIAREHMAGARAGRFDAYARGSAEWTAATTAALEALLHLVLTRVRHECNMRIRNAFESMSVPGGPEAVVWKSAGDVAVAAAHREADRNLKPAALAQLKAALEQYYE